jgi:hypothetical protein
MSGARAMSFVTRFLRRREATPAAPATPQPREGALTYVAHGDNMWGNAITHRDAGEHEVSVSGWLSRAPFPREGDVVLIKMQSGRWGVYVFTDAHKADGVDDMFQGHAVGAIAYADPEPQTKRCDEFIPAECMSPYLR